ncbi:MAG: hypothetical protein EOP19_02625 [Hyphomicrobiales bacterium]|nr:MAG: hypothetical protein EOP19_02625 [Hyphomicrobiales bacterium]
MPKCRLPLLALGIVSTVFALPAMAEDNEFADRLLALADSQLRAVAQNPAVVTAVSAQNGLTAGYDSAKIDTLDKQWRAEVDAAAHPLIDATLGTDASKYLSAVQAESEGLYTEIFVMDAKGLNVAQSTITSDYWQGDEDKFTQSFGLGPAAVHVGDIEEDESTQSFQSQVSLPITDATGAVIGAITIGVDLSII